MNRTLPFAPLFLATLAAAQIPTQPKPQTLTGCVAHIPKVPGKYVLATGDRCMLLTGTFDPAKIADHEISVRGLLLEPAGNTPLSFQIQTVQSTHAACTQTCILEPPGTRSIHKQERPGTEGGTPGAHAIPPSEPQD